MLTLFFSYMYYSTNNRNLNLNFKQALLKGLPDDFGLFMFKPVKAETISTKYEDIANDILKPYLEIKELKLLLKKIYKDIPPKIQKVNNNTYIMWLTQGPTYSFKDYAARFFGIVLNYYLGVWDRINL